MLVTESIANDVVYADKPNVIGSLSFLHPEYSEHKTQLLSQAVLPRREVEDYEIHHVDRRYFQGENMIRLVERVLNIDAGISKVYKYGYKNNHAAQDPP